MLATILTATTTRRPARRRGRLRGPGAGATSTAIAAALAFTPTQIQAAFDGPARAIRCAARWSRPARGERAVRAGLHTGECEVVGGEMRGVAVDLSSDLAALARPGEVLVCRTLVDLVAGSGLEFESRGPQPFGDNGDRFEIFAVRTPAA